MTSPINSGTKSSPTKAGPLHAGTPMLDLDYSEDSTAEVDMNVVMTGAGEFTELQGTAEGRTFGRGPLNELIALAELGIGHIVAAQRELLAVPPLSRAFDPR